MKTKPSFRVTLQYILNANVTFVFKNSNDQQEEPIFISMTKFFDKDQVDYFVEYGGETKKLDQYLKLIKIYLEHSITSMNHSLDKILERLIGIGLTFTFDKVNDGLQKKIEKWISDTFTPLVNRLLNTQVKINSEFIYVFNSSYDKEKSKEGDKAKFHCLTIIILKLFCHTIMKSFGFELLV